ncbi:MAG: SGNH/GDSL hydrolase family protein [Treponema sp.]|nr:SGNH/GDSL hydrolase family protein [Treponema sp.]
MKLTNKDLQKIYFGAYNFSETDDKYLQSFQYNAEQISYFKKASDFWYERCTASTSKTIEIKTDAKKISFDYKFFWKGSEDSFELCIDGLITQIFYVKELAEEGTIFFDLTAGLDGIYKNNDGNKNVIIYLPADATVGIKNFEVDGDFVPAKKNEKVLWLGDSITQGYGPLRSSQTYVSVANRILNYDIINQGIGGYVYDKNSLLPMPGYKPEKLIVALGTNQYGTETMKDIEEYYPRLFELYGKDIPTLVITPLWRGENLEGVPTLVSFADKLKTILSKYPNIEIVDGFSLVPHLSE